MRTNAQNAQLRGTLTRRGGLAALVAALGVGLLAAAPAQAGNEFENGFEDQIGRLLAVEAYRLGRVALFGGYAAYPHRYDEHRRPRHHRYDRPRPRLHRHPGHHEPCEIEHRGHHRASQRHHRDHDHVVHERYEYERRSRPRGHGRRASWRF